MRNVARCAFIGLLTLIACVEPRPDLEEFVKNYVSSVYADTEFYLQWTGPEALTIVEASRPNMSAGFKISGWDYYGAGHYEYSISFANGATGVVAIIETENGVSNVSLIVEPPTVAPPETDGSQESK